MNLAADRRPPNGYARAANLSMVLVVATSISVTLLQRSAAVGAAIS